MFRRSRKLLDPVTIHLDGEPISAERGEPLAVALLAADKTILARSPKLHRPRGPSCLRGGCDGCLARVDGVPNVMTCLVPARGGEQIDAQNVLGSRKADLLRVTDWFFADGFDHHHMLAGVPGLSDVMQTVAAKVAGLGRLPSAAEPPRPARRLAADVVVIGGGVSGVTAASRLGEAGRRVVLIDDGGSLGGALACAPPRAAELLGASRLAGVETLLGAVAAGCYEGEILVVTAEREAVVIRPRATLIATGAHDGVLAVPGNDLPGVLSARALCRLAHAGVTPDGATALVGDGFWADELAAALGDHLVVRFAARDVMDVRGTGGVRAITVREGAGQATHRIAVVAVALPGAPAFELAAQAGAAVRFDAALGYVVAAGDDGRAGERVWAAGECAGEPFAPEALRGDAERVAAAMLRALG